MRTIVIPPTHYLETSAMSDLARGPRFSKLRHQVQQLTAQSLLLVCTSGVTVEELLRNRSRAARQVDIDFARSVTPRSLITGFHPMLREMLLGGHRTTRCAPRFEDWRRMNALLVKATRNPPAQLLEQGDALRKHYATTREALARWVVGQGYPGRRARPRQYWNDPRNVCTEAIYLTRYRVFQNRARYADLFRTWVQDPNDPVTEDIAWRGRLNPWVRFYVRAWMLAVAKRVLRNTPEQDLINDYYDLAHVLSSSVADGIVTQDRALREAIQILGNGTIRAWSLDEWAVVVANAAPSAISRPQ